MNNINEQVVADLEELKKIGVHVKPKVIKVAKIMDLSEFGNMLINEISDLLIALN